MRVDAFEIAQNVEMQRTCLDALRPSCAQPRQMAFRVGKLGGSQPGLFFDQRAGDAHISVHENSEGKLQVLDDAVVERREFGRSLLRELELVLDFFGRDSAFLDICFSPFQVTGELK